MLKLSSIIIAKNEAANIRRCIESQLDCIDDIVAVIDDKSEDETLAIVKEYTRINCIVSPWRGYSGTKNLALANTKNDWILWIDADEELTPELADELKEFKLSGVKNYSAYKIARRAFFLGKWIKHSGWYPSYTARLFNKRKCSFSDSRVHEHLLIEGETGKLSADINHFTDPNIEHYFKKFNKYTTLAAEELFEKGKTAGINRIIFHPVFLFIKMYLIRRGFLDGLHGLLLAVFSSAYVCVKYAKLWELNRNKK